MVCADTCLILMPTAGLIKSVCELIDFILSVKYSNSHCKQNTIIFAFKEAYKFISILIYQLFTLQYNFHYPPMYCNKHNE